MSEKPVADGDLPDDDPAVLTAMEALADDDPEIVAGMECLKGLRAQETNHCGLPRLVVDPQHMPLVALATADLKHAAELLFVGSLEAPAAEPKPKGKIRAKYWRQQTKPCS